ncbi:hypothetical protein EFR84_08505 [Rhizobium chutanense]|uniref:Uncharacterized protein n=1 Tax=Rhizobium chutanense TaxID=2035448 RepID=A0A432P536_9HYPH|nr:hypothetical protein EFR84_08505 [Rhizobium chutanense]
MNQYVKRKSLSRPRTWAHWIPATSTGMRVERECLEQLITALVHTPFPLLQNYKPKKAGAPREATGLPPKKPFSERKRLRRQRRRGGVRPKVRLA